MTRLASKQTTRFAMPRELASPTAIVTWDPIGEFDMPLAPENVGRFPSELESFARRNGYGFERVDHDGDEYFAAGWITRNGFAASLTLYPRHYRENASEGLKLVAIALTYPVVTDDRRGLDLGTYFPGDDVSPFAERLEEGRVWAESQEMP